MSNPEKKEWWFLDDIKSNLSSLLLNIKNFSFKSFINDTLWKEVFKIEESTKSDLKKLEGKVLWLGKNDIWNWKLDETEWKMDDLKDKTTLLWLLYESDLYIKDWFDWISDITDTDENGVLLKDKAIDVLLWVLRNESDDNNNGFWDLYNSEIKKIWERLHICGLICIDDMYGDWSDKIPTYLKWNKWKILEAFLDATSWSKTEDDLKTEKIIENMKNYLKNIKPEDLETQPQNNPPENDNGWWEQQDFNNQDNQDNQDVDWWDWDNDELGDE